MVSAELVVLFRLFRAGDFGVCLPFFEPSGALIGRVLGLLEAASSVGCLLAVAQGAVGRPLFLTA